jgi:hypothetical protein
VSLFQPTPADSVPGARFLASVRRQSDLLNFQKMSDRFSTGTDGKILSAMKSLSSCMYATLTLVSGALMWTSDVVGIGMAGSAPYLIRRRTEMS